MSISVAVRHQTLFALLQTKLEAVGGREKLESHSALVHEGTALRNDPVHRVVVMHRVVMVEEELFDGRLVGRIQRILPGAVSPAPLDGILFVGVLRFPYVYVGAAGEVIDFMIASAVVLVLSRQTPVRFMVGHVNHALSPEFDAERDRQSGVVQLKMGNPYLAEAHILLQLHKLQPAWQIGE